MPDVTENTAQPVPVTPKATMDVTPEVVRELKQINESIKGLQGQLNQQKTAIAAVEGKKPDAKESAINRNTSRTAVTIAFGAIGAKLGMIIGAKVGLVKHLWFSKSETVKEVAKEVKDVSKNRNSEVEIVEAMMASMKKMMKITGPWVAGLGVLGAAAGVALGWKRGDRIEHPGDLLSHPLDSLGKIFGPAPEKKPDVPAAQKQQNTAQWADKVAVEQNTTIQR